ncbi:MAG: Hsp70 family protein [Planctomycetota bacterium]
MAREFKLKLGSNENILANGRSVTATDAAAVVLAKIKEDLERALNREVKQIVITVPANFRDDKKQALIDACHQAGLEPILLLPEPTAAGYAYAVNNLGHRISILVFDFGGGTFDASVLMVEGHQITVLATEGVSKLGGSDVNQRLGELVLRQVDKDFGGRPDPAKEPLFYLEMDNRVEQAKASLGARPEVPIVVSYKGKQTVVKIKREDFHRAIDPLVRQSLDAVDRVVAAAGITYGSVDRLLMVGGTSRIPYIQECLANHTGLVPRTDVDPDKAVVYGAALAYVDEQAKRGQTTFVHGKVIPPPDVFRRDVTAHAVGCCVLNERGANQRLTNAVIIPKNTPIPCQRVENFMLVHDDQTEALIEILQGEPDADRDQCLLIGEFTLRGLPKEAIRTPRLEVKYVIDANGMVTATATDKISGQTQTVTVDYKKGIKPKDKPAAA